MPTHAAQISFPGGRHEPKDSDLTATALREAHEELGLEAAHIEVIGKIDDVATPLGFVITPVVVPKAIVDAANEAYPKGEAEPVNRVLLRQGAPRCAQALTGRVV